MSDDHQTAQRQKPEHGDKYIPPPMDPYATYQTPYERRPSPEPNPFIEFRRFADKQFSDMFSSFSSLPKMFGMEDGMKNLREQLEKDMKDMLAHQKEMQDFIKSSKDDTHRPFSVSAVSATSPDDTSVTSQSLSTRKDSSVEAGSQYVTATTPDGRTFHIDRVTGHAVEKLPDPQPSLKKELEDRKTKWRRGFRNCPELRKYQGETELDVYESLEDQQRQSNPTGQPAQSNSWFSWLPAYGYDGQQRSKQVADASTAAVADVPPAVGEQSVPQSCQITTYRQHQSPWMDPFKRDRDFLPWLFLSRYSPLLLSDHELPRLRSIRLHNGCEGQDCHKPMQVIDHRQSERFVTPDQAEFRNALAGSVPWAEAFEDLISLEKTGKMPVRENDRPLQPHTVTDWWVRDMVDRGSLGPNWWLENDGIMRDSRADHSSPLPFRKPRRATFFEQDDNKNSSSDKVRMGEDLVDKIAEEYLKTLPKSLETVESQGREISNEPDITSSKNTPQTEFQEPQPKDADPQQSPTVALKEIQTDQKIPSSTANPKPSIISTLTTMTSRTLADGSIETKRVLKTRFADGKEESEESTEVVHPQTTDGALGQSAISQQQKKAGWFWT